MEQYVQALNLPSRVLILNLTEMLEGVLLPSLPKLLHVAGTLGMFGMTMTISMLSDLLSCFTVHLFVCYRLSAIIFSYQLSILGSLWNLFRGTFLLIVMVFSVH